MNNTDDTPLFSKRQLVQSLGQFGITFLTSLGALLATSDAITWRQIAAALVAAGLAAGGSLGWSYVPPNSGS